MAGEKMTEEFNKWWDSEGIAEDNSYREGSPVFWAWEGWQAALAQPEPEPVRLRRGDILRCIETNDLCTVWATSTTGKTQVKWKANDFGEYTAEQIGDLFWVEPKPEPEPVACPKEPANIEELYTAPPQREWQGLTDDEIKEILDCGRPNLVNIKKAEQKLKEKNT
jgi:hypothetical protein